MHWDTFIEKKERERNSQIERQKERETEREKKLCNGRVRSGNSMLAGWERLTGRKNWEGRGRKE